MTQPGGAMSETTQKWSKGPWKARGRGQKIWVGKGLISGQPGLDSEGKPLVEEIVPPHVVRIYTDGDGRKCTQFIATCNGATCPNEANALLISKAPEMADLLRELTQHTDSVGFRAVTALANKAEALLSSLGGTGRSTPDSFDAAQERAGPRH